MKKVLSILLLLCLLLSVFPACASVNELPALRTSMGRFSEGHRCPVYTGPSEKYVRGGKGKALVSSNDAIWVFGRENGYVMVMYEINDHTSRIGWLDEDWMKNPESVRELEFAYLQATMTRAAALTDDPLHSKTALIRLKTGTKVTALAVFGDWVYIEYEGTSKARGFVPAKSIHVSDSTSPDLPSDSADDDGNG